MHSSVICSVFVSLFVASFSLSSVGDAAPISPTPEEIRKGIDLLMEFKAVLNPDQFNSILELYRNESVSFLDKERAVVDYLSEAVNEDQRQKLPIPLPFRKLDPETMERIRHIYYQKEKPFNTKALEIGLIIQQLPPEERSKVISGIKSGQSVNDQPDSGLIEFEVNVTTHYNGFYEKKQLMEVLDSEDQKQLEKILAEKMPKQQKNEAIGQLLRQAYQRNPDVSVNRWPGMFGTQQALTDAQRHAVNHMLFSTNPTGQPGPLVEMLHQLVTNQESEKKP